MNDESLRIDETCGFCKNAHLITPRLTHKFVNKYIDNILENKSINNSFNKLKSFIKMSYNVERYIIKNYPKLYPLLGKYYASNIGYEETKFLRLNYLHHKKSTIKSTGFKCDYCNNFSCEFHIIYGNLRFLKCNEGYCRKEYGICGWCENDIELKYINKCNVCFKKRIYENKINYDNEINNFILKEIINKSNGQGVNGVNMINNINKSNINLILDSEKETNDDIKLNSKLNISLDNINDNIIL